LIVNVETVQVRHALATAMEVNVRTVLQQMGANKIVPEECLYVVLKCQEMLFVKLTTMPKVLQHSISHRILLPLPPAEVPMDRVERSVLFFCCES
jgi:hypothetical protein